MLMFLFNYCFGSILFNFVCVLFEYFVGIKFFGGVVFDFKCVSGCGL